MPLSGWTAGIVPFVLAGLLAGPAVGGSSHAPVVPLVVTASPDWSTYDTGRVQLVFPSPLPAIQILQDVNGSAAAWLSLEHVDELGPTDSSHPVVVRTASPEAVAGFNTTNPGSTPAWPLTLAADVKVQTSGVPLWSAPASAAVNQTWPNVGNTSISVNYTLANPSDGGQGVLFQWTVSNWPWVSSGDLLAVEFELRVMGGSAFQSCETGGPNLTLVSCTGSSLAVGSIVWDSHLGALLGRTPSGPLAVVHWDPNVSVSGEANAAIQAGTYVTDAGEAYLLLAAPAGGASSASGASEFYLAAPFPLAPPSLIHAEPVVYGGAAAGFAALVGAGWVGYRRWERRLTDSL